MNTPGKNKRNSPPAGQGLVEYALLLVLVVAVVTAVLLAVGPSVGNSFSKVASRPTDLPTKGSTTPTPQRCASISGAPGVAADFEQRILNYYNLHGGWPRSWGTYAFTDIGLNPADWSEPVDCIYWNPNGSAVGLANKAGDDIQIYVNDLNGNTLHLYDSWNIWCVAINSQCYYHTIAPGNEVNISTLTALVDH